MEGLYSNCDGFLSLDLNLFFGFLVYVFFNGYYIGFSFDFSFGFDSLVLILLGVFLLIEVWYRINFNLVFDFDILCCFLIVSIEIKFEYNIGVSLLL